MHVRSLLFKDCPLAARLHQTSFYRGWTEKDLENFLKDPLIHGLKIEEQVGELRGYILWRALGDEAEILTLVISPSYQHQGNATILLRNLFRFSKEKGISKLFLEVAEDNKIAQSFYINQGFVLLGKRPNYYKRKDNNFVGALNLCKIIE